MRSLPNLLSAARLTAAPYLFWLLWQKHYGVALLVMLLAGVTDAFDGYLARRWKIPSRIGELLDPIADKVLLAGAFAALWLNGAIEGWLAAIVFGRDLLILGGAGLAFLFSKSPRRFPPSIWGKLSTIVQMSLVVIVAADIESILALAKWLTAGLAIVSFADYAWRYTRS